MNAPATGREFLERAGEVRLSLVLGDVNQNEVTSWHSGGGGGGTYTPPDTELAITPGGRVGDATPLAKPGYTGKRKLTDYEREIAHALMRKKGFTKSHAIAVAKNSTRRWARGGGKVRPQVRAGAAASVAQAAALSTPVDDVVDLAVNPQPRIMTIALAEREKRRRARARTLHLAVEVARNRGLDIDLSWAEGLHPRDPFGRFRSKAEHQVIEGAKLEKRYRQHADFVDKTLVKHVNTDSTHLTHAHARQTDNGTEYDWSRDPERAAIHKKLVDNVYRRQAKTALAERKALFLGGLPGAGKTTALGQLPDIDQSHYITTNPDIFKEELAKHGLTPNIPGLSPMEASGLVHEESSHLAGMLAEKARRNGMNIAHDITMNSPGSVHKRLAPLNESGYTSNAVFVDIPFETSKQRVESRHRNGWLRGLRDTSGTNLGQRYVPSTHRETGRSKSGSSSANYDAFQSVKDRFNAFRLYDNSGKAPVLLDTHGAF